MGAYYDKAPIVHCAIMSFYNVWDMVGIMKYEHVYAWTKVVGVISNRVKVINWLLSSPDGSASCVMRYRRGSYRVLVGGCPFVSFRIYDLPSAESALARVDSLFDGLCLARRSGLSFT